MEVALATYLKNNYGDHMKGMKDKDWVADAAEVVEALGMARGVRGTAEVPRALGAK